MKQETLYENGPVRLMDDGGTLYLCDGEENYRITSEWHNPDTYLWRGDKTALVVYHGFTEEEIRMVAVENRTIESITGRAYDAEALCRLFLFGIREKEGCVDIGYLEKRCGQVAEDEEEDTGAATAPREVYGYQLKGTLRERVAQMIEVVSIGSYVKREDIRALYKGAGVPLYPQGEQFVKRYAYLFSSMSPAFEDEDDDAEFRFDTFMEFYDEEPATALRRAGAEESPLLCAVKAAAGCEVTPVGVYGLGDGATVYVGEDGRLYAIHQPPAVAAYDTIVDLMAAELHGHLPLALED